MLDLVLLREIGSVLKQIFPFFLHYFRNWFVLSIQSLIRNRLHLAELVDTEQFHTSNIRNNRLSLVSAAHHIPRNHKTTDRHWSASPLVSDIHTADR